MKFILFIFVSLLLASCHGQSKHFKDDSYYAGRLQMGTDTLQVGSGKLVYIYNGRYESYALISSDSRLQVTYDAQKDFFNCVELRNGCVVFRGKANKQQKEFFYLSRDKVLFFNSPPGTKL